MEMDPHQMIEGITIAGAAHRRERNGFIYNFSRRISIRFWISYRLRLDEAYFAPIISAKIYSWLRVSILTSSFTLAPAAIRMAGEESGADGVARRQSAATRRIFQGHRSPAVVRPVRLPHHPSINVETLRHCPRNHS